MHGVRAVTEPSRHHVVGMLSANRVKSRKSDKN